MVPTYVLWTKTKLLKYTGANEQLHKHTDTRTHGHTPYIHCASSNTTSVKKKTGVKRMKISMLARKFTNYDHKRRFRVREKTI